MPIWAYGWKIWGSAKPSPTQTIQSFQSITLRLIAPSPWYVTHNTLHRDSKIRTVERLTKQYYITFHNKLQHQNPFTFHLSSLTLPDSPSPRNLKRR